ncbi:expressed unknown protein [Seminavis robusta]|uniref:Uncharacterized protein n=1 Tax=Seminavis robusta TaxID=568900 RepID=A0A9N8DAG4_9STRA|nr:expressed unknown protein [Seminavis robusta]|eukprot:Sro1_g000920.1 n/a (480) ;mRNA; f:274495-275934
MNATMEFQSTKSAPSTTCTTTTTATTSGNRLSSGCFRRGSGTRSSRGFLGQKTVNNGKVSARRSSYSAPSSSTAINSSTINTCSGKPRRRSTRSKPLIPAVSLVCVEILLEDLEEGDWKSTRNFFAQLRFHSQARRTNMDQLAQAYRNSNSANCSAELSLETLAAWTLAEPDNRDAHLLHGIFLVTAAWSALQKSDQEAQFVTFQNQLQNAETALDKAIEIDPTDPLPYANKITASRELQTIKTTFQQFQNNCKKDDRHDLAVHEAMLYRLSPTWGGSNAELLQFARTATIQAESPPPVGHPLWSLMAKAHVLAYQEKLRNDKSAKQKNVGSAYWKDAVVRKEIVKAYRKHQAASSTKGSGLIVLPTTNNNHSGLAKEEEDDDDDNKETLARSHTNLFAYCLYKCKAFSEAYNEFIKIETQQEQKPTQEPWNLESNHNWKQFYQHAHDKVLQHKANKRHEKAVMWDSSTTCTNDCAYSQ